MLSAGSSSMAREMLEAAMLWAVRAHLAAGGQARMSLVTFGAEGQENAAPRRAPYARAATGEHAYICRCHAEHYSHWSKHVTIYG
jgi:hypothetical protein